MGKGNIYNDVEKGLYDLAISEVKEIKEQNPHLGNYCDDFIDLMNSYKSGLKKYKKDWQPLLEKIIP
jgi:hypothetical protein